MLQTLTGIASASFSLFGEMAPYLLIGIAAAGLLHVVLPEAWIARSLGGRGLKPTLRAALFGIPLPLCSCGVVPVAASLKKSGAGNGATVSFLVTTPTSGVDSILVTYTMLGGLFAVARVVASFVIGLVAGLVTTLTGRNDAVPREQSAPAARPPIRGRLRDGLIYGFDELLGGMTNSLLLGTLLGGAIAYFVPAGALGAYVGGGLQAYLIMMAFGIPLYVCASGSIPLATALLAKGLSPGAALVFLIAGPATNAATMGVILNSVGKRALAIFLICIAVGSLAAGWAMDGVAALWPAGLPDVYATQHQHGGLGIVQVLSGAVLGLLLLFHFFRPYVNRLRRPARSGAVDVATVTVPDMTCAHCAGTITKTVNEVHGVTHVFADPATKKVEVTGGDLDEVVRAIEKAGYSPTLDEV